MQPCQEERGPGDQEEQPLLLCRKMPLPAPHPPAPPHHVCVHVPAEEMVHTQVQRWGLEHAAEGLQEPGGGNEMGVRLGTQRKLVEMPSTPGGD